MSKNKTLTPNQKFDAVLKVLTGEANQNQVARSYNIQPNLISNWKQEFLKRGSEIFSDKRKGDTEKNRVEQLEQLLGKKETEIQLLKKVLN